MDFWNVFWTVYLVVAGTAMIMTYREQIRNRHRILAYRAAGLVACTVWPLVFPLVYMAARSRGV